MVKNLSPLGSSPASRSSELSKSGSSSSAVDAIKELLVLPKPNSKQKRKGRNALNSESICITDPKVLEDLKKKEAEKADLAE